MVDSRLRVHSRPDWRKVRVTLLVLAVLASFAAIQIAAAVSNHPDHGGPNDHCCAACHGGHYPVLQTDTFVHVQHLILAGWHPLMDDERPISREWNTVNSSRAPPA